MAQIAKISVVIPTFNRRETLSRTLASLHAQTFRDFEVLVVDDGSTDNTKEVVARFRALFMGKRQSFRAQKSSDECGEKRLRRTRNEIASSRHEYNECLFSYSCREDALRFRSVRARNDSTVLYFYQKNQGQGSARNLGVRHACAPITLFIGDDIIVAPTLLAEHVRHHEEHPEENAAVLGFIDWHPDITLTPFMRWITNGSCIFGRYGGHQFAYEKLNGLKMTDAAISTRAAFQPGQFPKKIADYNFFYTSNISLKTSLLRCYPFDPAFQKYGWEDIELGYRLTQKEKLVIYYAPQAKAFHYHPMDESSLAPRMRQIGASAHIIQQKYPELRKVPSFSKQCVFRIISSWPILCFLDMMRKIMRSQTSHDYYYYALSKKYFLEGTHEAKRSASS